VAQKKPLITKKPSGVAKNCNSDPVTMRETPLLSDESGATVCWEWNKCTLLTTNHQSKVWRDQVLFNLVALYLTDMTPS